LLLSTLVLFPDPDPELQATNELESAAPTSNGKILLFFMFYSSFEVCALLTVLIILFTSA